MNNNKTVLQTKINEIMRTLMKKYLIENHSSRQ